MTQFPLRNLDPGGEVLTTYGSTEVASILPLLLGAEALDAEPLMKDRADPSFTRVSMTDVLERHPETPAGGPALFSYTGDQFRLENFDFARIAGQWRWVAVENSDINDGHPIRGTLPIPEDAQAFWGEFRSAILANRTDRVIALAQLPFVTHGTTAGDPDVPHDSLWLASHFSMLLDKASVYEAGEFVPVRAFLQRHPNLYELERRGEVYMDTAAFSAAVFGFEKANGRWHLAWASVDF
jgi:hypothetical protein